MMTVEVEERWPEKADWASVGGVEVGAYAHGAIMFACDSYGDRTVEVSFSNEELRDLGEVCLALADCLDARAHLPAPPRQPIKLPEIHATREPKRFIPPGLAEGVARVKRMDAEDEPLNR